MNEQPDPMVYLSFFQNSDETTVMVKTTGDPDAMAQVVEDAIHQVNAQLPVSDVRSLRETTQVSSCFAVMESTFAMIFAIIALLLAATGIYGVVAYRTRLRTQEIGIRVALGASRFDVMRLVLYQGLQLTVVGLTLGLALALGLTRFLAGLLYGITATDPMTIVTVVALLGAIAVLACYLPAFRAMRLNPVSAIRGQ
jgi:ABC-type antimicrobial peptide transport system permease subunit